MIGPISSTAKLQMNTKPEEPDEKDKVFVTPRLNLNVVMELLAIGEWWFLRGKKNADVLYSFRYLTFPYLKPLSP